MSSSTGSAGGRRPSLAGTVLLITLVCACSAPKQAIEIPFAVRFGESPIGCREAAGGVLLSDLRLFVHDVALLTPTGDTVPVTLPDVAPWQGGEVALLDFENGEGPCRNGSAVTNTVIKGLVPAGEFTGLTFQIGVPSGLNHGNPLQAPPPLDITAMHWHWLSGYKFLRAGVVTDSDGFWLHLGSTRCGGTASAPTGCATPNRPAVLLEGFIPGSHAVVLDMQVLASTVDLGDAAASDCSSGPAELGCTKPFAALGIDFASGQAIGTPGLVRLTKIE